MQDAEKPNGPEVKQPKPKRNRYGAVGVPVTCIICGSSQPFRYKHTDGKEYVFASFERCTSKTSGMSAGYVHVGKCRFDLIQKLAEMRAQEAKQKEFKLTK